MAEISPLHNPKAEAVLAQLHQQSDRQLPLFLFYYLPRLIGYRLIGREYKSGNGDAGFLRNKLVALDPHKARLAYTLCRSLDAKRVVEVGTSFGVSTIYLASAMLDNQANSGGSRKVIGTEIEPSKVIAARENIEKAGLSPFVEIREGDALQTLVDAGGPVDFVLIDTWFELARPVIELLTPQLLPGALVLCDNITAFPKQYRAYTEYVRNPANGFRSMVWPGKGGTEISVYCPPPHQ